MENESYKVDSWNNFCMVFEMPKDEEYSSDFCHDGGHATNFQMVDWFYPVSKIFQAGCTKEVFLKEVGEIEIHEIKRSKLYSLLFPWLNEKAYLKENRKYIVICDFGASFIFQRAKG